MNDGSGIERVVFSYFEAFGRGDVTAVLSHYADDAVFMPADLPTVSGAGELRRAYERTLQQVKILPGGQSVAEDVMTLGEFSWVRTDSRATVLDPRTGQQAPGHFREVFMLRRVGEDWKIWRYMFNTITPAAERRP